MYAWTRRGSIPFDSPPKSVIKKAQFWGFCCPRVHGVIGENPSIPLDSMSFGGQILSYGGPWGVPTIPKVLCESVERIGRSGVRLGGVDPLALFIPSYPGTTGLTGALGGSDRCESLVGFVSGNCLVRVVLVCGVVDEFFACLELFC
jgi:hypothetical protein